MQIHGIRTMYPVGSGRISKYTNVVYIEACPNHLETVLIGTPLASLAREVRESIMIAVLALKPLYNHHQGQQADTMTLSGKLVQVARPTQENSLAQGMVGTAWSIRDMGDDFHPNSYVPDMYILEPEGFEDQEKVAGLLFTEGELEALP